MVVLFYTERAKLSKCSYDFCWFNLSNLTGIDSEFQENRKMVKTLKMNRLFNHFSIPDSESIYFPSLRNEETITASSWADSYYFLIPV